MPGGWEDHRRSGVAPAMRHRLQWFIHLRAHGLGKGDEHPAYTLHSTLLACWCPGGGAKILHSPIRVQQHPANDEPTAGYLDAPVAIRNGRTRLTCIQITTNAVSSYAYFGRFIVNLPTQKVNSSTSQLAANEVKSPNSKMLKSG